MKYLAIIVAIATAAYAADDLPEHRPITDCAGEVFNAEETEAAYFRACLDLKWPPADPSAYPAPWKDDKIDLPVKGPYNQFPLVHEGSLPWMEGGDAGNHRVVVNLNDDGCQWAGYVTKESGDWALCEAA